MDAFDFPDVGIDCRLIEGDLRLCLHYGQFMRPLSERSCHMSRALGMADENRPSADPIKLSKVLSF